MATVTKTTVELSIGAYRYRAELEGNHINLYRDGAFAGQATWTGAGIDKLPPAIGADAGEALNAAITKQLGKAWRSRTETFGKHVGPEPEMATTEEGPKPADAGNQGQLGEGGKQPSRQGEAEVGEGGPGLDPNTGELGGQAIKPHRRAVGDGFREPGGKRG
jgi:hypothetical protein